MATRPRVELTGDTCRAFRADRGRGPRFDGVEAHFLEARALGRRPRLGRELCVCRTAPQRERVAELVHRCGGGLCRDCQRGIDRAFESGRVDLLRFHVEHVARGHRPQRLDAVLPAQLVHEGLQRRGRGLRWLTLPEIVGQPIDRDHLPGVDEEEGQERAPLRPGQGNLATRGADLERTQDAELHGLPALPAPAHRRRPQCKAYARRHRG